MPRFYFCLLNIYNLKCIVLAKLLKSFNKDSLELGTGGAGLKLI